MKLVKFQGRDGREHAAVWEGDSLVPLRFDTGHVKTLADVFDSDRPCEMVDFLRDDKARLALANVRLLAPIDQQEVWAAGVTYVRSKTARMEESEAAASCYDRVYLSERPELFLKATPHRVVGHNGALRIRMDSKWNVPEPELTLVLDSRTRLVGYTIGNDMSSRDIEGDNPLYLPQAKVYNQCCGLGPCITLSESMPAIEKVGIRLQVRRDNDVVFEGDTRIAQMARPLDDLIHWLARDNSFPEGVFLLTGTGIVPDSSFTLQPNDVVDISIDGIGTLSNSIIQG